MTESIAAQARGLAMVLTDAERNGLPDPKYVRCDGFDVDISLDGIDDLNRWAEWAGADVTTIEPHPYQDRWSQHTVAKGQVHELPVELRVVEFGVMVEPETYTCSWCTASFGSSGGFVPEGSTDDDWFETEVARHQSRDCAPHRAGTSDPAKAGA